MAVAAHPDDIDIWCGGALARAIDAGATVRLLLVTSGDNGAADHGATSEQVAARREQEAKEAAARLGIEEVAFLRYPGGGVEDTQALRRDLVAWMPRWRPEVLFTHDPEHPYPPYLTHRDHRIVGRVALDVIYSLARDRLVFPEREAAGLAPHTVRSVWLFSSACPTAYVDITAGMERKIAARLARARRRTPLPCGRGGMPAPMATARRSACRSREPSWSSPLTELVPAAGMPPFGGWLAGTLLTLLAPRGALVGIGGGLIAGVLLGSPVSGRPPARAPASSGRSWRRR